MNQKKNNQKESQSYHTEIESFIVVLDSRNAVTKYNGTYNSSVEFVIEDVIRKPRDALHIYFNVLSFTCPISFYQINSTNCKLVLMVSGNDTTYSIPYGNYNVDTFITQLYLLIPSTFSVSFNNNNNIFTILNSTSDFSIMNTSTIYQVMGFAKNTTYTSVSNSLTLPFTVNFSGLYSFNIRCPDISTKNIDSLSSTISSIIASIPINNAQNNIIYYEKKTNFDYLLTNDVLDCISIDIQDDLGNFINFNNQHWNLVMQFNITYERERNSSGDTFYEIMGYEMNYPSVAI